MFIESAYTIAKMWKQHQMSMVYSYNRISFSLKKKEIMMYATRWMSLEDTVLSERSQSHGMNIV